MFFKASGQIYEGNWIKDEKSGEGYLIDPKEQTITKAYWRQGRIDGKTVILPWNDIGQVQMMAQKGMTEQFDIQKVFKLPDYLKILS